MMTQAEEDRLTREIKKRLFHDIYHTADRMTAVLLTGLFAFGIFLGFFYDTYFMALGVGGLALAAWWSTRVLLPDTTWPQYVASCVYAIFTALFIYQMHGLFEMHFFVFVGAIALVAYQNWRLQIPLIILILSHHALLAYWQYAGVKEVYFTQLAYMDLTTFLFHAGLAIFISIQCGGQAYYLELKTREDLAHKLQQDRQLKNIKHNIHFAEEISRGNLNISFDEKADDLGRALVAMRDNLRESTQREKQERFITKGINQISDVIRNNSDSLEQLTDRFVYTMVQYLGINQGGLFLLEQIDGQEKLVLTACYAFDRKKFLTRTFPKGDGLVGQCFLEKQIIYMTKVPDHYVQITSGLGGARPRSILLAPVMTSEEIVGVLELASFSEFEEGHLEFIKRSTENIASWIISSRQTTQVKQLLHDSQEQTETLKSQEEEMRQNMEEMQATQEEMSRTATEMESRVQAINDSGISAIEFELDGTIVVANQAFLAVMGYRQEEITGKHHRIFVSPEYARSEEYKRFWDDLRNGIAKPGEYERIRKDGTVAIISGSYSIIYDKSGKPQRILKLAWDITKYKQ